MITKEKEPNKRTNYLTSYEFRLFRFGLLKETRKEFDKISNQQKRVVFLKFNRNLSLAEIAVKLNITKSSVQTHLSRALKNLRVLLENEASNTKNVRKRPAQRRYIRG